MEMETSYMMDALENAEKSYVGPFYCVSGTYKDFPVYRQNIIHNIYISTLKPW